MLSDKKILISEKKLSISDKNAVKSNNTGKYNIVVIIDFKNVSCMFSIFF